MQDPHPRFPDELGFGDVDTYTPTMQLVEFTTVLGSDELLATADEALRSPGAMAMRLSAHGAVIPPAAGE